MPAEQRGTAQLWRLRQLEGLPGSMAQLAFQLLGVIPLPTPISPHRAGAETRVMSPEVPPVPTISSNELTGARCRPQVKC